MNCNCSNQNNNWQNNCHRNCDSQKRNNNSNCWFCLDGRIAIKETTSKTIALITDATAVATTTKIGTAVKTTTGQMTLALAAKTTIQDPAHFLKI